MQNSSNNNRDGSNESPWQSAMQSLQAGTIDEAVIYDTIVIGGGITGITLALMLRRAGQRCIVLEAARIGFGTTGGTSAHLNTFFDATYPEIESDFGADAAKLVAESGKEAMAIIAGFVNELGIDCDYESKAGFLFSEQEKETKQLMEILESSRNAGIEVTEYTDNDVPVPFEMALRFADQAQFHPVKYINALAREFMDQGGHLLEDTFVEETVFEDGFHTVQFGDRTVKAANLVYATHIPPGINLMNFTCAPYRSYVLGVKLRWENYPSGLSYDMQEPYHYFRTHVLNGQKYLIVGGEDHKTGHGDPEAAFQDLEIYVRKYYEVEEVAFRWSSQYYVPVDGLPYIGQLPMAADQTYVATGFNGNGMIFGTLSAKIICDEIMGIENKYASLFNPSRIKPVAGFNEFVRENADVAWHFIADRFSAEDLDSLSELNFGEGMVADLKGERVAVYKDEQGRITALSPTCTHAGCTVVFNAVEKSWDCPCHGGRYDLSGRVITGPPTRGLEKIQLE